MKRILATITTTILLVVVMSTAVYAAPATVGGTTTINAENFETKTNIYYKDPMGTEYKVDPMYVYNRTLQSDGTMDYKIDFNLVNTLGNNIGKQVLSGAYVSADNIIKETTQKGPYDGGLGLSDVKTLYSYGPVTVTMKGGPDNKYGDGRTINATHDFRISKGELLYCNWTGYEQLFRKVEPMGNGATTTTQTLTEPGVYWVMLESGQEMQGMDVKVCILNPDDSMDSNVKTEATAIPASAKVSLNGKAITVPAYSINGNNYLRIRDIAYILNGTSKQFDIIYNSRIGHIRLAPGVAYTVAGGEMTKLLAGNKVGKLSSQTFDTAECGVFPLAYNIDGSNFVQLREVGKIINFGVGYDNGTIIIDTSKTYDDLNK